MKIKLYRCTIRHTEHLREGPPIVTYDVRRWGSVLFVPGRDQEIVKIEEKEIEVSETCLRRKKV